MLHIDDGPAIVWEGPTDAPTVLVIDPAGEAKHGLPATWRPLTEHLRIGWCRVTAAANVEQALAQLDSAHLVTSGTGAGPVLGLALRHVDRMRSVVLVDPAPVDALRDELAERGVPVRAFASGEDDPALRMEPPAPLGHPDVVGRIVETLLTLEPEHGEIADDWRQVREHVAGALRRARGAD